MPIPTRALAAACAALLLASPAGAQSLLERPPNLSGQWVGSSGQLYFNFMHRFTASPGPERKVSNFPTFTMAAGLPYASLVGFHYATNSALVARYPNEWELFAEHAVIQQDLGAPADLGGEVAYNLATRGVDGEVSLARRQGPLRVIVAGRALSDPLRGSDRRWAGAVGGTLRVGRFFALAGDVAAATRRAAGEKVAWSGGVHLALPGTPHTLSLQATNAGSYTLQGMSSGSDQVRYGFEFTIPLTLSRWFGHQQAAMPAHAAGTPAAAATPSAQAPASGPVARSGMRNLAFAPGRVEIQAGTTVEWTNNDPLAHSVTAADGSWDSGLVQPGQTWRRTFTQPGTYEYHCTPHPFMKGTVIVR
ncbi:MAG: Plastocyanin/azurin family copper binding protein [Gemmatimonadetes bacterium]|nr:Plastocyanin/azurin family copper binding protein [Gemmatimonadota bacterium]